jgi:hypothetical protein
MLLEWLMRLFQHVGYWQELTLTYRLLEPNLFGKYRSSFIQSYGDHGGTVVNVLCYKSEGHWFDSRWCHWNFSLT